MKPDETIDFHIRWAWHGISRLYNSAASKYNSSMSVGYVLLNIDAEEGTPSTKLGPKMGMEPRSLTRTLKSMENLGLIARESDPDDKRMVRVRLTPDGIKMREISKEVVLKFNQVVQEQIPKTKLTSFFQVMNKLNEIIEQGEIFNDEKKN